jgi:hypothetical protein
MRTSLPAIARKSVPQAAGGSSEGRYDSSIILQVGWSGLHKCISSPGACSRIRLVSLNSSSLRMSGQEQKNRGPTRPFAHRLFTSFHLYADARTLQYLLTDCCLRVPVTCEKPHNSQLQSLVLKRLTRNRRTAGCKHVDSDDTASQLISSSRAPPIRPTDLVKSL